MGIEVKVKDNDEVIDDIEVAILVLETVTLLLPLRTFLTTPPPLLFAAPELILLVLDHIPLDHLVDDVGALLLVLGLAKLQWFLFPAVISLITEGLVLMFIYTAPLS